jgi:hypothetical protein
MEVLVAQKIVFVSYIIRGKLHSPKRRADILAARRIIETLRKTQREITFIAPYLLNAECSEAVIAARISRAGWLHNPPHELWVYGPDLCDGMRSEIVYMHDCDLPVVFKTPGLERMTFLPARASLIAAE